MSQPPGVSLDEVASAEDKRGRIRHPQSLGYAAHHTITLIG